MKAVALAASIRSGEGVQIGRLVVFDAAGGAPVDPGFEGVDGVKIAPARVAPIAGDSSIRRASRAANVASDGAGMAAWVARRRVTNHNPGCRANDATIPEGEMSYAIAAYVIVVGALLAYGLRIHQQRRALIRRAAASASPEPPVAPPSQ